MQSRVKNRSSLAAALAAAMLVPAIASAAPATTLYGGGASLPTTAYVGSSWFTPSPALRLSSAGDAGSLFGQYTASTAATPIGFFTGATTRPAVSYCQTGSGTGKKVLIGDPTVSASNACPDQGTSSVTGFGAPSGVQASFAGSDSPLSTSEFSAFLTNKSARIQPVQFPAIGAVIAVIYNNPAVKAASLPLSESKICRIFSGEINNWKQLGPYPSKPIKVVFRSDGSGTSFAFSNHLSKVCPTAEPIAVTGFKTNQTFSSAFPVAAPAGSIGAPQNGGVTTAVSTTDGAIGFADVADTSERIRLNPSISLKFASVVRKDGINPATGLAFARKNPLQHSATFALTSVLTDKVIASSLDANGRPVVQDIASPPRPGCVLLADPDSYATSPLNANGDYLYYPIVAVSYLMANAAGNGQDTKNLQALLAAPYGRGAAGTYSAGTTTIGAGKGYLYLTGKVPGAVKIAQCVKA